MIAARDAARVLGVAEATYLRSTREAYDRLAAVYAERFRTELAGRPLDRALLAAFAEFVRAAGAGPVADLGCGPGNATAHLHSLGLTAFGVDLSPEMVRLARQAHPDLRFEEGSMTALDLPDGTLGGILSRYSIIHIPPDRLPDVFAEFHRVLASGGYVMLAFQAGEGPAAFDHKVSLAYRWPSDGLAALLSHAGLPVFAQLLREPDDTERFQQAYLLARKTAATSP